MLLNLRAMANSRAGNDPATTQLASIVLALPGRRTRGESNPRPHWATFDLTSGRLTSIHVTFDLESSRATPFESKSMIDPESFVEI